MEWLFLYLLFDTSYRLKVLSGYRYRDMNADTVCNLRPCPLFLWYIHGQMYCQVLQPIHGQMYCQVLQCTIKLVDTSWSMLCIYWHKRILLIIIRDQIGAQLSTQMKFNIHCQRGNTMLYHKSDMFMVFEEVCNAWLYNFIQCWHIKIWC